MLDQHAHAVHFVHVLVLLSAGPEGAELFAAVDVGVAGAVEDGEGLGCAGKRVGWDVGGRGMGEGDHFVLFWWKYFGLFVDWVVYIWL
ncbi:uncharacterized protein EAF02_006194 [Botrytis sinoallii]|uniref:uncharacterized protein n=1 Tax=Botrytis sinoallii TaxID=1463999 RepID=UPI0018FFEDDA|nr:uncharacterized protein EAF02_006194 [Botrytis sinoallii]KAF7882831.1 hypothetical protein EAF02_006194 [Botrytis sinoallii]